MLDAVVRLMRLLDRPRDRKALVPLVKREILWRLMGMSVSAFHRNFHAVTSMSPIQFQKQIRLQEARLLLANRPNDITGVGYRVEYDSPSQFSREYRRQFGAPPSVDAVRVRSGVSPRCGGAAVKVA